MKIAKLSGNAEIFHTIQGEGLSSGLPCIFLRLSQCNLHCIWCDTDYTWNWVGTNFRHVRDDEPGYRKYHRDDQIIDLSTDELFEQISAYSCPNLVVTGGEPLMQQNELSAVLLRLKNSGKIFHVEVETNGTIVPDSALDDLVDQYNVSVKLENSGNPERLRLKVDALNYFTRSPKSNFKFVVAEKSDLVEIEELLVAFDIAPAKVILMPLGTDTKAIDLRESWLTEICKQKGYRFSDRMHIRLYGNKRGV